VALDITQSKFGFTGETGPDDLFHDNSISQTGWELCTMYDKTGHRRPPGSFRLRGLYGRVLADGIGFFTNDPLSHSDSIGLPEGHPPLTAFLGVPLEQNGRTIGMVAVANREGGYSREQQEDLEILAPAMVEAFLRKRAEEALRKAHDELERRVRERAAELREKDRLLLQQSRQAAMGEMINNIAHQWRQPLNGLGLIIQSLPVMYGTEGFGRGYLETMGDRAMQIILHMSQTIDDFRNYFKPDKEKVWFKVNQPVSRTIKLIEESFKNLKIAIEVNPMEDPVIHGYPNEFGQVLLNILINARDAFSERNVSDPKIFITLGSEKEKAVVTVADNAGGIPENILDKIFDPYFTTKGPDQGTGIGLFMSKTIIEKNMGGKIVARNTAQGAEFRIEV
jgi:signal transduction histidine kinase